jgi:hypothetical protein
LPLAVGEGESISSAAKDVRKDIAEKLIKIEALLNSGQVEKAHEIVLKMMED